VTDSTMDTVTLVPLSKIDAELEARQKRQDESGRTLESLENELADKRKALQLEVVGLELNDSSCTLDKKLALERSIQQLDQSCKVIQEARSKNGRHIGVLSSYRKAVLIVQRGLPASIIGSSAKEKTPNP
jgi:hypothetical protein